MFPMSHLHSRPTVQQAGMLGSRKGCVRPPEHVFKIFQSRIQTIHRSFSCFIRKHLQDVNPLTVMAIRRTGEIFVFTPEQAKEGVSRAAGNASNRYF